MRLADVTAWRARPDFLLWLNDDVDLQPDAVRELLDAAVDVGDADGAVRTAPGAEAAVAGQLSIPSATRNAADVESEERVFFTGPV